MAVKNDLRLHSKEIEALSARVESLEAGRPITSLSGAVVETPSDLSVRIDDIEALIADVSTMGPKKLAIKFGARMDDLDERLQALEAHAPPEAHCEAD